jgi:Flp pilus assembly protein CpaB
MASVVACWPHQMPSFGAIFSSESADSVPVLVAGRYVSAFQVIKSEDVRVRYFPKEYMPLGALHAKAELVTEANQSAFSSLVAIPQGEALTRTILIESGKDEGLSHLLRSGNVAVSFSVDKSRAAGGWIQPGDTIALFETASMNLARRPSAGKRTQLLLSAVKVLAVDKMHLGQKLDPDNKTDTLQDMSTAETDTKMVTVLVNPVEAALIVEAREGGPLSLVLRAMGDDLPWPMEK